MHQVHVGLISPPGPDTSVFSKGLQPSQPCISSLQGEMKPLTPHCTLHVLVSHVGTQPLRCFHALKHSLFHPAWPGQGR